MFLVDLNGTEYLVSFKYKIGPDHALVGYETENGKIKVSRIPINGTTFCHIEAKDGDYDFAEGRAFCSAQDRFNKKIGRKLAFRDSIQDFTKEERTLFWEAFKENVKL